MRNKPSVRARITERESPRSIHDRSFEASSALQILAPMADGMRRVVIGAVWLCLLGSVSSSNAQTPKPWVPPHYPTPTEKLPATLPHDAFHPVALTGKQFTAGTAIGHPANLTVQGNLLWVGDQTGDPFLHVFDLSTGLLRTSLGRKGEGPGDFRSVGALSKRPGDTAGIWVTDLSNNRMTRVTERPERGQSLRIVTALGTVPGAGVHVATRMQWLSRDRILFIGRSDSNRIMLADSLGHVVSVVPARLLGTPQVTRGVRETVSEGVAVCTRPSGGNFALAYGAASRIDLFDGHGKRLGDAKVPIPNLDEGDFAQDSRGGWHNPMPRYYYRACAVTPNRFYVLFSGRLGVDIVTNLARSGPEGTHVWEAQFVHVFDWSGNLLGVFKLDQLAEAITVVGDSVLFAGGESMDGIYRYVLPPLAPRPGRGQ